MGLVIGLLTTVLFLLRKRTGSDCYSAECNLEYPEATFKLLVDGASPKAVIEKIVGDDPNRDIRQVLVINKKGEVAGYTGKSCVRYAQHFEGEHFAVAGNMLANNKIIPGISDFYISNKALPFTERVIKTLQEGQRLGGDFRGKRSAGLIVISGKPTGKFWKDIKYDLRTDDNVEPLREIERLYNIANAYKFMDQGDEFAYEKKDNKSAMLAYESAYKLFPENPEIRFWYAKLLSDVGMIKKSKEILDEIIKEDKRWAEYWERVQETD